LAIWRLAASLGLTVSCVGTTAQFTASPFIDLLAHLPRLSIVLEHLGGIARPDADESAERVWDLARFPNVALKATGLGQLSKRMTPLPAEGGPFQPGSEASLRRAVEVFSSHRIMWGSDFPVVSSREGYANALAGPMACLDFLGAGERSNVFGGTAARFFPNSAL
jgi:L-fuconolactonase